MHTNDIETSDPIDLQDLALDVVGALRAYGLVCLETHDALCEDGTGTICIPVSRRLSRRVQPIGEVRIILDDVASAPVVSTYGLQRNRAGIRDHISASIDCEVI